jgi:hypothetical protein
MIESSCLPLPERRPLERQQVSSFTASDADKRATHHLFVTHSRLASSEMMRFLHFGVSHWQMAIRSDLAKRSTFDHAASRRWSRPIFT